MRVILDDPNKSDVAVQLGRLDVSSYYALVHWFDVSLVILTSGSALFEDLMKDSTANSLFGFVDAA